MRNFIWSFSVFFCIIFSSFSQTKSIEKGTYINKSQKIKLNLLEENKCELVYYYNNYEIKYNYDCEIKGDSLLFTKKVESENEFDLAFTNDKKAQKIKIKFFEPYYSFYIGTQKSNDPVQYQKISDIRAKIDPDFIQETLEFELDKADYLYLACDYENGESALSKFALPKDVSEVTIKYQWDVLDDLNIAGFFDQKTNELRIFDQKEKIAVVLFKEKDTAQATVSKVVPTDIQTISNWTYPGKDAVIINDLDAADEPEPVEPVEPVDPTFGFKFKIENNLKNAISSTKNKLLVIYVDSKNPSAKADFDAFIKDQEVRVGYYAMSNPKYDIFNYYLTSAEDKKWLQTNKITDNPYIIVLNKNGDILATSKSKLAEKEAQFYCYDKFHEKAQRVNAFLAFDKVIKNKKATDIDLIMAFNKVTVLNISDDYYAKTSTKNPEDFKLVEVRLDKKTVSQTWKKIIEAHQKDTKPNMYLVETIQKEIKNLGFSKQFFNEDKVWTDIDFLSIEYLIKHIDAIETQSVIFNKEEETHLIGNLISEITSALQQNTNIKADGVSGEVTKNKTISVFKKLIAARKGNFECYVDYFAYLGEVEDKDGSNTSYLNEVNNYFNANLATDKGSAIDLLNEMYVALDPDSDYFFNGYNKFKGWDAFKEYHANLCNSAAWLVVLKPVNTAFLKSAIAWSEYSLVVIKKKPHYLDTLAQLYYKDGQIEKAIKTQTLAVKYLNAEAEVDEETAAEIQETLVKMKKGTY